jgi:putative intracellular protease/amidase
MVCVYNFCVGGIVNEKVSEFLAAYVASSCVADRNRGSHSLRSGKNPAQKDATALRLLIEPKGKAATVATLDYLAQQVSRVPSV